MSTQTQSAIPNEFSRRGDQSAINDPSEISNFKSEIPPPDSAFQTPHSALDQPCQSCKSCPSPSCESCKSCPPPPVDRRLRHGLRSRRLWIEPGDEERWLNFHHAMMLELDPQDHTERFFAEQIIARRWSLMNANEAEAAASRKAFAVYSRFEPDAKANNYNASRDEDERDDHALAKTATADEVQLALRYRTSHERSMKRMEDALRQYRQLREINESNPRPPKDLPDQKTNFRISPTAFTGQKSTPLSPSPASTPDASSPANKSHSPSHADSCSPASSEISDFKSAFLPPSAPEKLPLISAPTPDPACRLAARRPSRGPLHASLPSLFNPRPNRYKQPSSATVRGRHGAT